MTPWSFRICLTTVTLLHADFSFGSDLQDFVNTIKVKGEYSENNNSRHHLSKKSLVIFIPDLPSKLADENYQEARKLLLRSQDLSDELLKVDNDQLRMPAGSIVKKNSNKNAPKSTRVQRMHNNSLQYAMDQKERDHERRVKEIVDHVSVYHQSCIYLTYEARRIKTGRVIMDDFRKMAEDVQKQRYQGLKAKVLKCAKPIREPVPFVWGKTNNLVINVVKDSLNEGVL